MKSLGITLKEAREHASLTLRQVEEATDISAAYLSQLENDKIKKPSANTLYKLANILKVELDTLLIASGIIKKSDNTSTDKPKIENLMKSVAFYADDFDEVQQNEIIDYIKYIKFKSKNG